MYLRFFRKLVWFVFVLATCASAQRADSCIGLMKFKGPGVEITKATPIAAGTTEPDHKWYETILSTKNAGGFVATYIGSFPRLARVAI